MKKELKEIVKKIKVATSVAIFSHASPDADCVGSAVGMAIILRLLGKAVTLHCPDDIPLRLQYILSPPNVPFSFEYVKGVPNADLFISLDVATKERLTGLDIPREIDIKIDHHSEGSSFAKLEYVEGNSASCGEIVYKIAKKMLGKNVTVFNPLYCAMAGDTGCFRYSNTTLQTLQIATEMKRLGVDFAWGNIQFEKRDARDIIASSLALANMELLHNNTVSFMQITTEMMKKYGVGEHDFGSAVGIARSIDGVNLSIVIRQTEANPLEWRVSTRSNETFNCAVFCAKFGGGGHDRAAGASIIADSPEMAKKIILDELEKSL